MDGISCSSVAGGFFTIVFEVNVIDLVVQDMPCGDKKFSGDDHNDFHPVFLSYLCLMIGEPAEEAVPGPVGRPCAFDDGFLRKAFPWVMRLDFIFLDSSFLGFSPLQEARWLAVSNLLMSVPISAINDVAALSFDSRYGLQPSQLVGEIPFAYLRHLLLALLLVPFGKVEFLTQLSHDIRLSLRYDTRQSRQNVIPAVMDASVDFPDQLVRVCNALGYSADDIPVALAVHIGDTVAQADVAALHHGIQFGQLADYLLVEIEDAAVVLAELLYDIWRDKTAVRQLLHRAFRYPLRILHVALTAGKLPDEIRIDQTQPEMGRQHTPVGIQ